MPPSLLFNRNSSLLKGNRENHGKLQKIMHFFMLVTVHGRPTVMHYYKSDIWHKQTEFVTQLGRPHLAVDY